MRLAVKNLCLPQAGILPACGSLPIHSAAGLLGTQVGRLLGLLRRWHVRSWHGQVGACYPMHRAAGLLGTQMGRLLSLLHHCICAAGMCKWGPATPCTALLACLGPRRAVLACTTHGAPAGDCTRVKDTPLIVGLIM